MSSFVKSQITAITFNLNLREKEQTNNFKFNYYEHEKKLYFADGRDIPAPRH